MNKINLTPEEFIEQARKSVAEELERVKNLGAYSKGSQSEIDLLAEAHTLSVTPALALKLFVEVDVAVLNNIFFNLLLMGMALQRFEVRTEDLFDKDSKGEVS